MITAEYQEYLRSEQWQTLKSNHPSPRECVACQTKHNLRLHHMVYPKDIWRTKPHHCCWLCEGCHDCFHRACIGEREKYKPWAIYPERVAMIVRAQRREEDLKPAGEILMSMFERLKVRGGSL